MAKKDISQMIERLEAFEERAGVRLEALSAFLELNDAENNTYQITALGEIHAREGTILATDIELTLAAYDSAGRVVGTSTEHFWKENFFGFEAFQIYCTELPKGISRIRLLPKAR